MVREAKRLGRTVVVHVRGREGALYAARAGVDILYHASRIDDEGIRAARDNGCYICPSMLLLVNNIQYAQPDDASFDWWPGINRRELADAKVNLRKAYDAGVRFLSGSETGFAITPYGEWAAKEFEIMAAHIGLSNAEVLRIATHGNRALLRDGTQFDALAPGKIADFIVVDGDPLAESNGSTGPCKDQRYLDERRTGGAATDAGGNSSASARGKSSFLEPDLYQGNRRRLQAAEFRALSKQPLFENLLCSG